MKEVTPQDEEGYPPRCGGYPPNVEDTPQDVEDTPQDKGKKSKNDPRPGAVKSHLKTARKWTVFCNL